MVHPAQFEHVTAGTVMVLTKVIREYDPINS